MRDTLLPSISTGIARLALLLGLLLPPSVCLAKTTLRIACTSQVASSFTQWTSEIPWDKIEHYAHPSANRPTLDLVLQLQALKTGGFDFDIQLIEQPNNERCRLELGQGNADLSAESVWTSDIRKLGGLVLQSALPLIRSGEFEKGIYVLPSHINAMGVNSLERLRELRAAVVSSWELDVKTLAAIKPRAIEKPSRLESVYSMIQKGRADFTLIEFSSIPDMSNELQGIRLVPVPGIKVALPEERFFIVSAKATDAKAIQEALDKGLSQMREQGRIERAFKESGFFHPKARPWKRLF